MASCDELFATMYEHHDRMLGLMAECLRRLEKMTTPPSPEMKEEDSTVTTTEETLDDVPDEQLHPVAVPCAQIHLSIDSTDEVDPDFNLVKVCGGCPLREKMNKAAGNSFVVIVDRYEPVPVEVVPFTAEHTLALVGKVFDELPGPGNYVVVEHGMVTMKAPWPPPSSAPTVQQCAAGAQPASRLAAACGRRGGAQHRPGVRVAEGGARVAVRHGTYHHLVQLRHHAGMEKHMSSAPTPSVFGSIFFAAGMETWARIPAQSVTFGCTRVPGALASPLVEYLSSAQTGPATPPVFIFVIDTCMVEEEIGYLKSALAQAVELLPDNSLVGLVTELGFGLLPKSYVFKGTKEVSNEQILEQMCFFAGTRDGLSSESIARFLLPASKGEFVLNSVIDELQKDPWPVPADQRASRCTRAALSVATNILGVCVPGSGARIMAFVGSPSTEGPGSIVSKSLSEPIRSHKDLDKDSAPLYDKAVKLYDQIAKQLVHQGHVLELFASAVDQVGAAEMKVAIEKTGGIIVLAESFGHSVFKDSLLRICQSADDNLGLSFNGILEMNCSKDVKIQGIIGPCTSLEKKSPLSSDTVVGQGNTSAWKMCGLDRKTSLCIVYDIVKNKDGPDSVSQSTSNQFYFQFLTYYQHNDGQMRLRSTTISRRWISGPGSVADLSAGFDWKILGPNVQEVDYMATSLRSGRLCLIWLEVLKLAAGSYTCVAESEARFTSGRANEELLRVIGMQEEQGNSLEFYKTDQEHAVVDLGSGQHRAKSIQVGRPHYLKLLLSIGLGASRILRGGECHGLGWAEARMVAGQQLGTGFLQGGAQTTEGRGRNEKRLRLLPWLRPPLPIPTSCCCFSPLNPHPSSLELFLLDPLLFPV